MNNNGVYNAMLCYGNMMKWHKCNLPSNPNKGWTKIQCFKRSNFFSFTSFVFLSYFRLEMKLIETFVFRKTSKKLKERLNKLIKYHIIVTYILRKTNHHKRIILRTFQRKWQLFISAKILCNSIWKMVVFLIFVWKISIVTLNGDLKRLLRNTGYF